MTWLPTLLVLLVIGGQQSASAQVFRWIDPDGTIHLTDDAETVPKGERVTVKVYESRQPSALPEPAKGERLQQQFARMIAKEFGLIGETDQDPVSLLNAYGIYPKAGWRPQQRLGRKAALEVADAARMAAQNRRLEESPLEAHRQVLSVAKGLGLELPAEESTPAAEPLPTEVAQPIVVSPEIVVQTPPPVVIDSPRPVWTNPAFLFGVPFAPAPGVTTRQTSRARRVANVFGGLRTAPLPPFRERVRRAGFNTLATAPLESMFAR